MITKNFNNNMDSATGLGIIPMILAGGAVAAAGGAATLATKNSYESGWIDNLLQWIGLKDAPKLVGSGAVFSPPLAPQTEYGMRNWSPDFYAEATAQYDDGTYQANQANAIMNANGYDQSTADALYGNKSNKYGWVIPALAVGTAVYINMRK